MNIRYDSKFRDLVEAAKKQGFTIERTKGNHWKFIPPDKTKVIVIVAGSPSDFRAINKITSRLKNSGLIL